MNLNAKKRIVVSFRNLSPELQQKVKEKYPNGFTEHMIRVDKGPGDFFYAVVFETSDTNYLIKVDVKIDDQLDEEEEKDFYDEGEEIKGAEYIEDSEDEDKE